MKRVLPAMGGAGLGLLLLLSFWLDVENVTQGGAIDLRNRITGIRLLEHAIDPYHYKWEEPKPPEYCDPYNNPLLEVSKTTATPALLLLHLPLAPLPYRLAQFLWFLAQWALLLGTALLWFRRAATSRTRWLLALFTIGFTFTAAWRLHAERGQAYVLLLFLFAGWLVLTLDPKRGNGFGAGFLAGFLTALRPPFVLLFPFLALRRRGQLLGAVVGLMAGIALPMLLSPGSWLDYNSAMATHSTLYRNDYDPAPPPQKYPAKIEGVPTDILANYVAIPYADFSVHGLLRRLGFEPFPALPVLLAIAIPFGLWLVLSRDRPVEELLLGLVAWLFLADLFLPAYRDNYNDVLILNGVALGLVYTGRNSWGVWSCFAALPLGWAVVFFVPDQPWIINLSTFFFTVGAILLLFLSSCRSIAPSVSQRWSPRPFPESKPGAAKSSRDLC